MHALRPDPEYPDYKGQTRAQGLFETLGTRTCLPAVSVGPVVPSYQIVESAHHEVSLIPSDAVLSLSIEVFQPVCLPERRYLMY